MVLLSLKYAKIYYLNAVLIWAYFKDKSTAPEANLVRLSYGFPYCFDAVTAAGTKCTIGSDTSGALTADVTTASEISFGTAPASEGQAACYFLITPSA